MARRLPDVPPEQIDILERKAFIQSLITPPLLYVSIVLFVILISGMIGGGYWLLSGSTSAPTATLIAGITPTQEVVSTSTENISPEPTLESTPTLSLQPSPSVAPSTPPTVEATETVSLPTAEPTVPPPTLMPTEGSTLVPTVEPTVVTPTPTPTEEPSSSPTIDSTSLTGKIAVPVFNTQTSTYDLYIVSAPDWQLSAQPFQKGASQPAFSPDGAQIVFRSWGGPSTSYSEQLIIRPITGTTERFITNHPEDAHPHWENFDYPIVFHTRPSGGSPLVCLQALWDSAPQDPKSRLELAVGENPTWLPDGRIVYFSGQPSGRGLYIMNTDGSGVRLIWGSDDTVAPKGDPTNTRVIFSNNDDLYLLTATDGESQPEILLKTQDTHERLPIWSPDGQFIAYAKDQNDNNWAVYVVHTDGTGETKLFDLPGSIDGKPFNIPSDKSFGWSEEQLAWGW